MSELENDLPSEQTETSRSLFTSHFHHVYVLLRDQLADSTVIRTQLQFSTLASNILDSSDFESSTASSA